MSRNCLRPRLPIVRQARNRLGKHHPFGNYCSSPALDPLSRARGAMIGYRIRGFARSLRSDPFLWHKRISAKKRLDPFRGFCVSAAMIGTFAKRFVIRNREMSMKTSSLIIVSVVLTLTFHIALARVKRMIAGFYCGRRG
jgi:hypothetical protein